MVTITIGNFRGSTPRVSPRLISDNFATEAENARMDTGMLRGMRELKHEEDLVSQVTPRRVFRVKRGSSADWFVSGNAESELVQSPLVNETLGRWYLFGKDDAPKVILYDEIAAGDQPYRLGVAPPLIAPRAEHYNGSGEATRIETRVYVMTYVTEWGEETSVSPPVSIDVPTDAYVELSHLYSPIYRPLEGREWAYVRVYRTVYGRNSAQLYFVDDIPWGDESYIDEKKSSQIVFNTTFPGPNDEPPDGLQGARVHPSGAMVAFKGRDVHFSRPYLPHAWPEEWVIAMEDEIVALEVVGSDVLVLTKGRPVVLYGQTPESMGRQVFAMALPCSNYRAVVAMPEGIYYPSREGLVLFTANGPQFLTTQMIAQDQWARDFYAEDIVAARDESSYVALRPNGDGFVITQDSGGFSLCQISVGAGVIDFHRDKWTGRVYFMQDSTLFEWGADRGNEVTYRWRSKEFYTPDPLNFAAVRAEFDFKPAAYEEGVFSPRLGYNPAIDFRRQVVFRAWADGELVCEIKLTSGKPSGFQTGYRASVWQFEVEGQCPMHTLSVAENIKGLQRG